MQETQETWFNLWVGKVPWRRKWQPTPVFLPGKAHGQRGLAGYSPWGCGVRHDLATKGNNKQDASGKNSLDKPHALCCKL